MSTMPPMPPTPPTQPAERYAWWVYVLVVLGLIVLAPLWLALALIWWAGKAMGLSFEGFARMWVPQRIPARFRNHGRSS